jgi:adenine-specific DNA-methyltransferase
LGSAIRVFQVDFFAGSGTTGHAILALNAEDDCNRTFVLVSSKEATPENPERNLCRNVCAERVRHVIEGHGEAGGLGGDFAYLRVARIPFEDLAYDLTPAQVWLAIRVLHGCEVAPVKCGAPLQTVVSGEDRIVFCDKVSGSALDDLKALAAQSGTMTPGPVRQALRGRDGVEVRALPDALVRRFQS